MMWGDVEPLPMPTKWSLVGGTEGNLTDGPTNPEILSDDTSSTDGSAVTETPALYRRFVQSHAVGTTCSSITLKESKLLRVLDLQLTTPPPEPADGKYTLDVGRGGFSIRQILVLGPSA